MSYLVIGLAGPELLPAERDRLAHDAVAGAILFARNWQSPAQLAELTEAIRRCCPKALILVDQEGGRVQRFTDPLTALTPLATIGQAWDADPDRARELARAHGELMAREVVALGVDLSLAPILDVYGPSSVIGDRAFHRDPLIVSELGKAYRQGMRRGGMAACGKHFPGHGSVIPDTHIDDAVDERSLEDIWRTDLLPFADLMADGLESVMLAHVCYPAVCPRPVGYSRTWIQTLLRDRLKFDGVIISDDLGMRAAASAGDFPQRVEASLAAGCDLLLVCQPEDVAAVFDGALPAAGRPSRRVDPLRAQARDAGWDALAANPEHQALRSLLA